MPDEDWNGEQPARMPRAQTRASSAIRQTTRPQRRPGMQVSTEETRQDGQGPEDAETNDGDGEATRDQQGVTDDGQPDAAAASDTPEDTEGRRVHQRGDRATIGVQRPSSDPHIESFDDLDDLPRLTQEVSAVIDRARAKWEEEPRYPAHARPTPPARRRSPAWQQGSAQAFNRRGRSSPTATRDAEAVLGAVPCLPGPGRE